MVNKPPSPTISMSTLAKEAHDERVDAAKQTFASLFTSMMPSADADDDGVGDTVLGDEDDVPVDDDTEEARAKFLNEFKDFVAKDDDDDESIGTAEPSASDAVQPKFFGLNAVYEILSVDVFIRGKARSNKRFVEPSRPASVLPLDAYYKLIAFLNANNDHTAMALHMGYMTFMCAHKKRLEDIAKNTKIHPWWHSIGAPIFARGVSRWWPVGATDAPASPQEIFIRFEYSSEKEIQDAPKERTVTVPGELFANAPLFAALVDMSNICATIRRHIVDGMRTHARAFATCKTALDCVAVINQDNYADFEGAFVERYAAMIALTGGTNDASPPPAKAKVHTKNGTK